MRSFWTGLFLSIAVGATAAEPLSPADVLPFRSLFSREELQSGFDRHRIHPLGEREIHFDVVVPKDWHSQPVAITQEQILEDAKRPVGLARFTPADRPDVAIVVEYVRLPGDDAGKKAIDLAAKSRGAEIAAGQRGDFSGRMVDDALLRGDAAGADRWTRATASRHGELVFIVLGEAPRDAYEAMKRIFGAAAVSFAVGPGTIRRDYDPRRMEF
jgi:hypothetical protein